MAFDLGSVIAHIKADTTQFDSAIKNSQNSIKSFGDKVKDFGSNLTATGAKMTLFAAPVALFLRSASNEAMDLEKNLVTLDIIAGRFGVSGKEAQDAAQGLGRELRIGVGAAANGLQNLLKGGLSLDQATDMMKRFTNEAITGKSNSISLGQAVENLSFAYATNNSAIGNLSGINENFQDIIEKGKQALIDEGVAVESITEEMAKYRGMIDLTNLTMGSSERFHGTLIDKQAEMGQKIVDLKVAFGELINPVLSNLVDMLIRVFDWLNSLSESQKTLILTIAAFVIAIGPVLTILGLMVSGVGAVISILGSLGTAIVFLVSNPIGWLILAIGAIIAAGVLLYKNWDEIKAAASRLGEWVSNMWSNLKNKISQTAGGIFDAMVSPFRNAWNTIQDLVNKIKDSLDFTKRHSPSVVDIVRKGVGLVNGALEDLSVNTGMSSHLGAPAIAASVVPSNRIYQIQVSLPGAIISDDATAKRFSEMMGDNLVRKLQASIRV